MCNIDKSALGHVKGFFLCFLVYHEIDNHSSTILVAFSESQTVCVDRQAIAKLLLVTDAKQLDATTLKFRKKI